MSEHPSREGDSSGGLSGDDPGDRDDTDDDDESDDRGGAGAAAVHQPLAMMPTIPLMSRNSPIPATAIQTVMRAGEIWGFSPGVGGVLSLTVAL